MKQTIKSTNKRIDELLLRDAKYKKGDELKIVERSIGFTSPERNGVIARVYIDDNKVKYDVIYTSSVLKGDISRGLDESNFQELPAYIVSDQISYHDDSSFEWSVLFEVVLFIYGILSMGYTTWQIIKHYIGV